jgi:tetratricopeptide (TPR) repeat protein
MSKKSSSINHKKLLVEIGVVVGIIASVCLFSFAWWLGDQPIVLSDPYANYTQLYQEVISRPQPQERDSSLEKRLAKAVENEEADTTHRYFNYKAQATYYHQIEFYDSAIKSYKIAIELSPDEFEYSEIADALVDCYTALGLPEKAKEYEFTE